MGRNARISENPIKEIKTAADDVMIEAANIATPAIDAPVDIIYAKVLKVPISSGFACYGTS
jgi:hypothetical protein